VDIGAESGRVMVGRLADGRIELEEVHRFPNRPVQLPEALHWNVLGLFGEALVGLAAARERMGELAGVAVDAWAVDYALLDERHRLLGLPFHYRDPRTAGMAELAFSRVPARRLYEVTGIQVMPINTLFQLLAEAGSPALAAAERLAMIPDLLTLWLCGELASELTNASTTGLLDARSGAWALGLVRRLGLPQRIFGPLVEPGTVLAPLLRHLELGSAPVIATASHDTAAAFAAVSGAADGTAVLSSGTWSLLGVELEGPILSETAWTANLTNERGVDGTVRLLKNVMGLWLLQECRRAWAARGTGAGYEELIASAAAVGDDKLALFDPDHETLFGPGDMPARIAVLCEASGQKQPSEVASLTRSILTSLACKYRFVVECLEETTARPIDRVRAVGGGARNSLLCALTADILGRPVYAGPFEATALGNVLLQARATGDLSSLAELRVVAAASTTPRTYEPGGSREGADAMYERFLEVTGLAAPAPALGRKAESYSMQRHHGRAD
jgi:rhamnulokinase